MMAGVIRNAKIGERAVHSTRGVPPGPSDRSTARTPDAPQPHPSRPRRRHPDRRRRPHRGAVHGRDAHAGHRRDAASGGADPRRRGGSGAHRGGLLEGRAGPGDRARAHRRDALGRPAGELPAGRRGRPARRQDALQPRPPASPREGQVDRAEGGVPGRDGRTPRLRAAGGGQLRLRGPAHDGPLRRRPRTGDRGQRAGALRAPGWDGLPALRRLAQGLRLEEGRGRQSRLRAGAARTCRCTWA